MALLKEDGSLDVEHINKLPLEEYMDTIGDLSEELHELIEEQNDASKREFIRQYFN